METEIEEFVNPKHRHHNSSSTKTSDKIPAMVNEYIVLLQQLAKNEKSDNAILIHLDQFYAEYQKISNFFHNKYIINLKNTEIELSKHAGYLQNELNKAGVELKLIKSELN